MVEQLSQHLDRCFPVHRKELLNPSEPVAGLPGLRLVRIHPSQPLEPTAWITLGLSAAAARRPIELLWVDPYGEQGVGENLLPVVGAHVGRGLHVGDTVALGRGWRPGSPLDHVLLTWPYCYGPALADAGDVSVLWCVPVHGAEVRFIAEDGLEAFERRLESARADFTDPRRVSVI